MPFYEANNTMTHFHHVTPKHAGGTDDPSNLKEMTVKDHAEAHHNLWLKFGREEDRLASLSLSGCITTAELERQLRKIKSERTKAALARPEIRAKLFGPKPKLKGPKSAKHKKAISKTRKLMYADPLFRQKMKEAAKHQRKATCEHCGFTAIAGAIAKYHGPRCKTLLPIVVDNRATRPWISKLVWITDGKSNKRISGPVPDGWRLGRTFLKKRRSPRRLPRVNILRVREV